MSQVCRCKLRFCRYGECPTDPIRRHILKRSVAAHLRAISIDADALEPLYRQLYFAIRDAILSARLRPGQRLPAMPTFSRDLGLSRNTVVSAFDQLLAEGYIEGRTGAGTYVSTTLPEELLNARATGKTSRPAKIQRRGPSKRGTYLSSISGRGSTRTSAFSPGIPELAEFPFEEWARLLGRKWRDPPRSFLVGNDPLGLAPLREAIASYLGAARAVQCDSNQVIIVSGAQQAIDLTAHVLIDPGASVWMEEPGFQGMRGALLAAGAELAAVPVDNEGISVSEGERIAPDARLACVSPSHQYPLGVTMTLGRRLELLEWARRADAFILEDDYDSEYRYRGRPLAALQGLDEEGRVIYIGTMSKVMFPGLRIGYMVVPDHLVDAFRSIRVLIDSHPSSVAQAALAYFISEGFLSAHIRRMRALYSTRQATLIELVRQELGGFLKLTPKDAGMHLLAELPRGLDDTQLPQKLCSAGVQAPPLSAFYDKTPSRSGFLLGYAGFGETEMTNATRTLAQIIPKT